MKQKTFLLIKIRMLLLAVLFTLAAIAPGAVVYAEDGGMVEYTVQSGDCLYKIAQRMLGDGNRWNEIYQANKKKISDPSLIYIGQVFVIPADDASATEQAEAENLADEIYDHAAEVEPTITSQLKSLENDQAKLIGLEHRLKTKESLSRKILKDAHDMEVTPQEAASTIHDAIRYTFVIDEDSYVTKGNTLTAFKNYWADDSRAYQGINTNFKDANGTVFELQFHTPESFDTKESKTHDLYEIIRDENSTAEEKAEATQKHDELFKLIPVPEGVRDLQYQLQ